MGFQGVIVSDALDMAAIADHFSPEDILRLSIHAGASMLFLPVTTNTNAFRKMQDMTNMARNGWIDMRCINDSVRRILSLKKRAELQGQTDFALTEDRIRNAKEIIGSEESRRTAWAMVWKAMTFLRNDHAAFPVHLQSGERVLILFAASCASRTGSGNFALQILRKAGRIPDDVKVVSMAHTGQNEAECLYAAKRADHVILVHRTTGTSCLRPGMEDGFSSLVFDRIIRARHSAGKTVILVSCQLPYDAFLKWTPLYSRTAPLP